MTTNMATSRGKGIVDARLVGTRVQAHPATDAWMMGNRYGEIVKVGSKLVHVKMDKSGKVLRFTPNLLLPI
jgi:hypothetical protein